MARSFKRRPTAHALTSPHAEPLSRRRASPVATMLGCRSGALTHARTSQAHLVSAEETGCSKGAGSDDKATARTGLAVAAGRATTPSNTSAFSNICV